MIADVDDALRTLIRRDALNGADVEVVFDAPTKEWSARRNAPTVDVYLYDIREDLKWRAYGSVDVRGDDGMITRFEELGFPTTRLEDWRHTSVAAIARTEFHRPPASAGVGRQSCNQCE